MKTKAIMVSLAAAVALCASALVAGASSGSAPPSGKLKETVTPIKEVHKGAHVLVEGKVHRIRDTDEFVLKDETGRVKIYIGWKNRMPVSKGDTVKVWGVADDDTFLGFRPEIYAYAIGLPAGGVVHLTGGDD